MGSNPAIPTNSLQSHSRQTSTLVVGAICLLVLALYIALISIGQTTHGFVAYYVAARTLLAGDFGAQVYDDSWFRTHAQQLTSSGVLEIFGPNPPTMALLALPVAGLAPTPARTVWLILSLSLYTAAVWSLARGVSDRRGPLVVAVVVALLSPAVFANLRTGQAYLVIAALFVAATEAFKRRRDGLAGVLLCVSVVLKAAAVPWVLLVAVRQNRRAIAGALVSLVVIVVVSLPALGVAAWMQYPDYLAEFVLRPENSVTAYQTTLGAARHLCTGDPTWNPAPAAACSSAAFVVPVVLLLTAGVLTVVAARGARRELVAAVGICLSVLGVPIAEDHHFVLLVVPLFVLLSARPSIAWWLAVGTSMVPPTVTVSRFSAGWWALLAYPRLYAAWLLWGLTVATMYRERSQAPGKTTDERSSNMPATVVVGDPILYPWRNRTGL